MIAGERIGVGVGGTTTILGARLRSAKRKERRTEADGTVILGGTVGWGSICEIRPL